MRVLLLGRNGQVGSALESLLKKEDAITVVATDRANLNLTEHGLLQSRLSQLGHFDWIINAAAYTAVDKAESEYAIANAVNHLAVGEIAQFAHEQKARLLHFSTDYVFDGKSSTPYVETDLVNPINIYGETKLAGEKAIQDCLQEYFIVRTSWVFSAHGHNFLKTIIRLLQEKQTLNIVADQQGTPTAANALAQMSLAILKNSTIKPGIYHYSNEGATTWYDFALYIKEALSKKKTILCKEIKPITTLEYPTPAKRPLFSILNTQKIKNYGIHPTSWQNYVDEAITVLLEETSTCTQKMS